MTRTSNYCAFYVAEPFHPSSLGAHATKDFVYYNLLRGWKGLEPAFPFNDAHAQTYSVRDGSDWELTLKPRLRQRLRASKNIVLFLSSDTKNSTALREEIDYGINDQGLPVIVIYPEYKTEQSILSNGVLRKEVKDLWGKVPAFLSAMKGVPTLHIPLNKETVRKALSNSGFRTGSNMVPDIYTYKV